MCISCAVTFQHIAQSIGDDATGTCEGEVGRDVGVFPDSGYLIYGARVSICLTAFQC
jgi:hypothetical protein